MPKDTEDKLELVRVDGSNIDGLAGGLSALQESFRGQSVGPGHWRWSYIDNPLGRCGTVVALRKGRVVGKLGNTYMRLVAGGELVTASLMEGLSIEESERSWQCFSGILKTSRYAAAKDHVAFGFGFSTRSASELVTRLGSVSLGRAPILSGFLDMAKVLEGRSVPYPVSLVGRLAGPFVGLKVRGETSDDLEVLPVDNFDASFDDLWRSIVNSRENPLKVAVVKDSAYLNWRYVKCPDRHYTRLAAYRDGRPEGVLVYLAGAPRSDAFLLELMARGDAAETMRALLSRALGEMKSLGAGLVSASFPEASPATRALKGTGFKTWGTRFWNMDIIVLSGRKEGGRPELELSNWDFSLGDWLYH